MRRAAVAVALLALVAVPVARASEDHPTSLEVQNELYCDDCQTTLAEASSVSWTPAAIQQIHQMIREGYKKSQIKQTVARKYYGHLEVLPAKPASNRPTLADLEGEIMCPVCDTTLDQSSSPAARQIKALISARIAAGDSKQRDQGLARRRSTGRRSWPRRRRRASTCWPGYCRSSRCSAAGSSSACSRGAGATRVSRGRRPLS